MKKVPPKGRGASNGKASRQPRRSANGDGATRAPLPGALAAEILAGDPARLQEFRTAHPPVSLDVEGESLTVGAELHPLTLVPRWSVVWRGERRVVDAAELIMLEHPGGAWWRLILPTSPGQAIPRPGAVPQSFATSKHAGIVDWRQPFRLDVHPREHAASRGTIGRCGDALRARAKSVELDNSERKNAVARGAYDRAVKGAIRAASKLQGALTKLCSAENARPAELHAQQEDDVNRLLAAATLARTQQAGDINRALREPRKPASQQPIGRFLSFETMVAMARATASHLRRLRARDSGRPAKAAVDAAAALKACGLQWRQIATVLGLHGLRLDPHTQENIRKSVLARHRRTPATN